MDPLGSLGLWGCTSPVHYWNWNGSFIKTNLTRQKKTISVTADSQPSQPISFVRIIMTL